MDVEDVRMLLWLMQLNVKSKLSVVTKGLTLKKKSWCLPQLLLKMSIRLCCKIWQATIIQDWNINIKILCATLKMLFLRMPASIAHRVLFFHSEWNSEERNSTDVSGPVVVIHASPLCLLPARFDSRACGACRHMAVRICLLRLEVMLD